MKASRSAHAVSIVVRVTGHRTVGTMFPDVTMYVPLIAVIVGPGNHDVSSGYPDSLSTEVMVTAPTSSGGTNPVSYHAVRLWVSIWYHPEDVEACVPVRTMTASVSTAAVLSRSGGAPGPGEVACYGAPYSAVSSIIVGSVIIGPVMRLVYTVSSSSSAVPTGGRLGLIIGGTKATWAATTHW